MIFYTLSIEQRDPVVASMGVSDAFELLFEDIEIFREAYEDHKNGVISQEEFNGVIEKTSLSMERIASIIDGYQFIPMELSESLYNLEDYFYNFDSYPDTLKENSLSNLESSMKKNSAIKVSQLYKDYPNFLKGEIPNEMRELLADVEEVISTVK